MDLVQLEAVDNLEGVEVPNDNISLEAGVGLLAGSNVLSRVRDGNDRDVVVVTAEEVLGSGDNVAQHNSGSKRVHNVLVVGVEDETFGHSTLEANDGG